MLDPNIIKEKLHKIPYRAGPLDAKIAFIGEAPGRNEVLDKEKRPFIGKSGQYFRSWLRSVGIDPAKCYITNLLKERPPDNKFAKFAKKNPKTIKSHTELLRAELSLLTNCNLIVPVGNESLRAICNRVGITSWRGSIIKTDPNFLGNSKQVKCIPIIHPAHIMRQWSYLPATKLDLVRVEKESHSPNTTIPKRKYVIRPSLDQVVKFLTKLMVEATPVEVLKSNNQPPQDKDIISVDTETKLGGRIATIQFCNNSYEALCIPFQYGGGKSYWSVDEEIMIWKMIQRLLYSRYLVGQNFLMYDTFILGIQGFDLWKILDNVYMDTMEAFQCYQPSLPKSLAFLTSVYTREPYYKKEGKEGIKEWSPSVSDSQFWIYGCKDVLVVHEMFRQIEHDLKNMNMWNFYKHNFTGKVVAGKERSMNHRHFRKFYDRHVYGTSEKKLFDFDFEEVKQEMKDNTGWKFYRRYYHSRAKHRLHLTEKGFLLDKKKRKELKVEIFKDVLEFQCQLNILTGRNLNVKSSPQMKTLLYEDMKLRKQFLRGRITCNEDAILKLSSENPSEVFDLILKVRQARTLWSNYINVQHDSDDRVRSSYGFTETGRFTSYKCPLRTGYNLQNWPYKMRSMLRSDNDDYVLIEMDLSQAESRAVAWKSQDTELMHAYSTGIDVHKLTASNIFETLIEKITKTRRYTGKRVNHAANYDIHPPKFAKVYNKDAAKNNVNLIDIKTAQRFMALHHTKHPSIRQVYQAELRREVEKTKTLYNYWGRRIVFYDRLGPELFRQAYAWWAQSLVGDLTNVIFDRVLHIVKIPVLNQCHDSLIVHVHKDDVERTILKMKEVAEIPLLIEGRQLIIPVDFAVGTHWGSGMKQYELQQQRK